MMRAGASGAADDAPLSYGAPADVAGRLSRSVTIALLLSPVGLLLLSITRLLIVANYNPVTASAIVSSGGYVEALFGTLIPLVPVFMPYIALALLFFNRVILGTLAVLSALAISPAVVGGSAVRRMIGDDWHAIAHAQIWLVVIMAALALAVLILLVIQITDIKIFFRTLAITASIMLIPLTAQIYPFPLAPTFYKELIRQPWLPAEIVTLQSGQKLIGYILKDDGNWLVILRQDTRTVVYYHASEIASLQICQLTPTRTNRPLITVTEPSLTTAVSTPIC